MCKYYKEETGDQSHIRHDLSQKQSEGRMLIN